MLVLWVIGILHFIFLFTGDILHDYALGGMLLLGWLLLFRTRRLARFNRPEAFLKIALVWLLVPFIVGTVAGLIYGTTHDPSDLEQGWAEAQEVRATVDERVEQAGKVTPSDESDGDDDPKGVTEAAEDAGPDEATEPADESENEADEVEKTISEKVERRLEHEKRKQEEIEAYTEGSYWQATAYRAKTLPGWLAFSPVFTLVVLLPIFLVGYWFVASGTLRRHRENRHVFKWMAIVGTTFGLFLNVVGLTILQHPVSEVARAVRIGGEATFQFGQIPPSAGYVGLIVLAADTARGRRWLEPFAPMGRMALTNYIMHSLILVLIFHAYGADMFGRIPRAPQMLIVVPIVAFQMIFSAWWLKRYRFGPLEWVWRSLTYKSWQPMRIAA
jgi:uncharacterized protein